MKTTSKTGVLKGLRYLFLALAAGGALLLLLNLTAYFGLSSDGPFIRGWVTTLAETKPQLVAPHPDGSGDLKVYSFGEQKFVMLEFRDMTAFLQARYLGYLLFQNLAWVLAVWVLYQMYRIFGNLEQGIAFHREQIRRIKWIAAAILAFPVVQMIASRMLAGIAYEAGGHQITTARPPLLTEPILLGGLLALVLYALAEVFRYGHHLQQEQDLTI